MKTARKLSQPTTDEVSSMVRVFVDAFDHDPSVLAQLGQNWQLAPELFQAMIKACIVDGEPWVVSDAEENILSVALWFGPDKRIFGTPEQRALGYDQLLAKLSPEIRQWWTNTYPDSLKKFLPTVMTPQEQTQRWMCSVIATSVKHQGKGYASAIMDAVYSKAVETDSLIALITTKDINVPIYQRMGMRLRGRGITPSPYGDIDMFCLARTVSE